MMASCRCVKLHFRHSIIMVSHDRELCRVERSIAPLVMSEHLRESIDLDMSAQMKDAAMAMRRVERLFLQ